MCEQARPSIQASFSACFARSQSKLRGLPLGCGMRLAVAVFAAAKTSGRVRCCGGAIVKPARFAAAKRRHPRGRSQPPARQARTAAPSGARSAQKKGLNPRDELARTFGFQTLFRIACRSIYAHKNAGFRESSRESFTLKAVPRSSPPPLENPAPLRYNKPDQTV